MAKKNPYDQDTPEWHLYENMMAHDAAAAGWAAESDALLKKVAIAKEKVETYRIALGKLTKTK